MSFEMDVKYGANIVYNPTGFEIKGGCDAVEYTIKPFSTTVVRNGEEVDGIYDIWHVAHLLQSCKAQGLVSLEYGKKAKEKFKTFEAYRTHQEIQGLKARLQYQRTLVKYEDAAIRQMKEKGATVDVTHSSKLEAFQKRVDAVEGWLEAAGATIETILDEEIIPTRPEWREKKKEDKKPEPEKK